MSSRKKNKRGNNKSLKCDEPFNYKIHCISCGEPETKKSKLSSTDNGMNKIKQGALVQHNENISQRISSLEEQNVHKFFYHARNYNCYGVYARMSLSNEPQDLAEVPEQLINSDDNKETEQSGCSEIILTRGREDTTRNQPCSSKATTKNVLTQIKCGICNKININGDFQKSRIEEYDAAQEFLDAMAYFKDEVFTRYADIKNVQSLVASDVYCHKNCRRKYIKKYNDRITKCILCDNIVSNKYKLEIDTLKNLLEKSKQDSDDLLSSKLLDSYDEVSDVLAKVCYIHTACKISYLGIGIISIRDVYKKELIPLVNDMIHKGYYLTLSEIRDQLQENYPQHKFYNWLIQDFLTKQFVGEISICRPYKKNDSIVIYPSNIETHEIIAKIQNYNSAKNIGIELRNKLLEVDFGLGDSFCDSNDLNESWLSTHMPEALIEFFAGFLNMKKVDLMKQNENVFQESDEDDEEIEDITYDENNSLIEDKIASKPKQIIAQSLFQTLFYSVHRGKEKSPLHVMLAHLIYDKTKSKTLITSLNKLGYCISYSEYRRCRDLLGGYALKKGQTERVPLPSHLNYKDFMVGAIDNFDHEDLSSMSGKHADHDTVTVLFQNYSNKSQLCKKPKVSEFGPLPPSNLPDKLQCQKLEHYIKPNKKVSLPSIFKSYPNPQYEDSKKSDVIKLVRNSDLPKSIYDSLDIEFPEVNTTPTWAGSHSLVSTSNLNLKRVGFVPILPYPITKHEVVYTSLINLKSIATKLEQKILPFFCDEGVYQYVIDIYFDRPSLFDNIFPMLGGFHMTKAALRCAGKYLRGSGIEDGVIEPDIFGPKTLETVLGGTHYYRSFKGLSAIEDAVIQLKHEGFWSTKNLEDYGSEITEIAKLKNYLCEFDSSESKSIMNEIIETSSLDKLLTDLDTFTKSCTEKSEMCLYWENFIQIMQTIKNLIRSDREGDFLLHIKTVGELCSIFTGGDGINYMRCASFYHEMLKGLQENHPELYSNFMKGDFVIKSTECAFSAVSGDMKLEQSIMRSTKSIHGIIGQTKCLNFVQQWTLLYHEVLDISNKLRDLIKVSNLNSETVNHNELTKSKIKEMNECTGKIKDFIKERGNPYQLGESTLKLKNFSSQVVAHSDVSNKLLKFHELSSKKFKEFHKDVYVDQNVLFSDKITKFKLDRVDYVPINEKIDSKEVKRSEKMIRNSRKVLNIVKRKSCDLENALKYDITEYNPLFDNQYMTQTSNKSQLMSKLEEFLQQDDYEESIPMSTTLIIDFMSFVRNQKISSNLYTNFGQLALTIYENSLKICPNNFVHFIFDSYITSSLKGPERERRGQSTVELASISDLTKIPNQIEKFWASSENKKKFQEYIANKLCEIAMEHHSDIVLSGTVNNDESKPCKKILGATTSEITEIPILLSKIEEADQRIIPHIRWSLLEGHRSIVVASNDTDVLVLILHYYKVFISYGLEKMWIRVGSGTRRRFIPIHTLYNKLPKSLCEVLLAAHIGTGCDYISKMGTKLGALNANPEDFLVGFGNGLLDEATIVKCEQYLVKVCKKNAIQKTFDEFRCSEYLRNDSIFDLPPTSHSIVKGHIPRWFFIVKELMNLLNAEYENMNPCEYAWKMENDDYLPEKYLLLIPESLTCICNCKCSNTSKRCNTMRCKCKKNDTSCTEYCGCQEKCDNGNIENF